MKVERLPLVLLSAALGALILGQSLSAAANRPPRTATAEIYAGSEPVYAEGTVIRQERAVYAPEPGSYVPVIPDGTRAAAGERLMDLQQPAYVSRSARSLRVLRAGKAASDLAPERRRAELRKAIAGLSGASGRERQAAAETVAGLVMGEGGADEWEIRKAEQLLLDQSQSPEESVKAPAAGIFVSWSDGLETVLTPEDPWAAIPEAVSPAGVGRLVTGDVWYFRGRIPMALSPGDVIDALLPWDGTPVEMTVEAVRDGMTLLSCGRSLDRIAGMRNISIKIMPKSKIALEIPAEALYTVGEAPGVWCVEGPGYRFKPVEILEDRGETLLVDLDQSTTDSLWPGDQILLDEPDA